MKRLAAILAAIGLLLWGYCALVYFRAARYQAQEKARLSQEVHSSEAPKAVPAPTPPARGDAIALLTIARIGLSTVVLEGAGTQELKLGPGHIASTPLPGKGGNFSVAGHRDTFFRPLRFIRPGDAIQVQIAGSEFRYRVVSTHIVSPHENGVLRSTGHETLTLVTCYPFDFVGSAPQRFIVRADCDNCMSH
jgi:sortase A